MMDLKLTRSSFRSIYGALVVMYVLASLAVRVATRNFIEPKLLTERMSEVESLVHSHGDDIQRNNVRALRDELTAKGIIARDPDFLQLKPMNPGDASILKETLAQCAFKTAETCVGPARSLILDPRASPSDPLGTTSYAVALRTDYFSSVPGLALAEFSALGLVALLFLGLGLLIRNREMRLVSKLDLVVRSVGRIEGIFGESDLNAPTSDEFVEISNSVGFLSKRLQDMTRTILDFKAKFERKTRLEQIGQTVSQVNHDLKAPLNEMLMFLEAMPAYVRPDAEASATRSAKSIRETVNATLRLLDGALERTAAASLARDRFTVAELLDGLRGRIRGNADLAQLQLVLDVPTAARDVILVGDKALLGNALINLVQNTVDERRDATFRVTAALSDNPQHLQLVISDNGPGIPLERLERVFEPLVTYKPDGRGLGLSGAREAVTLHGGSIRAVESTQGARFIIEIPCVSPTAERSAHGEATA